MSKKFSAKNAKTNELINFLREPTEDGKERVVMDEHGTNTLQEGVYSELLNKVGVTDKELKRVQEAQNHITTAVDAIATEKSYAHFKANKDAKSTQTDIEIGHNRHSVSIDRKGDLTSVTKVNNTVDDGDTNSIREKAAKLFADL